MASRHDWSRIASALRKAPAYRRLELWTNGIFTAARRICQAVGFTLKKVGCTIVSGWIS